MKLQMDDNTKKAEKIPYLFFLLILSSPLLAISHLFHFIFFLSLTHLSSSSSHFLFTIFSPFSLYLFYSPLFLFFKSPLLSSFLSLWLPLSSPSHSGGFHVNKKLFLDPVFFLFCIPPFVFFLLLLLAFLYLKPHKYRQLPSMTCGGIKGLGCDPTPAGVSMSLFGHVGASVWVTTPPGDTGRLFSNPQSVAVHPKHTSSQCINQSLWFIIWHFLSLP